MIRRALILGSEVAISALTILMGYLAYRRAKYYRYRVGIQRWRVNVYDEWFAVCAIQMS